MSGRDLLDAAGDFDIAITAARPDRCSADNCTVEPALLVTVCYCSCDREPEEHGHPGSTDPSAARHTVPICDVHGAVMAHTWECFEGLENAVAVKVLSEGVTE